MRFIGNHSSGKMGFRIAESLLKRGASVVLISGPTREKLEHPNLRLISIESAEEMLQAVQQHWPLSDIGIFAAAVADYRPKLVADQKIKKKDEELTITLVKTPTFSPGPVSRKRKNNTHRFCTRNK